MINFDDKNAKVTVGVAGGGGGGAVGALRHSGHRQWWLGQAGQVRRRQQSCPLCQVGVIKS